MKTHHNLILPVVMSAALLVLLALACGTALAASAADRVDPTSYEAVSLTGSQVPVLVGAGVPDLYVFTYHAVSETWTIIPFQVDEVDASGNYTTTDEIPTFDANDELVWMVRDLGDQAPAWRWLDVSDLHDNARVEVKVSDPANPADAGWAYVFRTSDPQTLSLTDYVNYSPLNHTFDTPAYLAGLSPLAPGATGWHPGLDRLEIKNYVPSSQDILDRTHIRLGVKPRFLGFCLPIQYLCEDGLSPYLPPGFDLEPTKDGPIRVVGGSPQTPVYIYRDSLFTNTALDLSSIATNPNVCAVTLVRVTFDLRDPVQSAYAPATYYDSAGSTDAINGVAPVPTISGAPRSWVQYSGTQGTVVVLDSLTTTGGTATHYYRDDSSAGAANDCHSGSASEPGSTGSYGESGTAISNPTGLLTVTLAGVIQPPAGGPIGQTARTYQDNPLSKTLAAQYLCTAADVNGDHQITVAGDVTPAAGAWGCTNGNACYLPAADINQDNQVDVEDVQFISGCFGWSLP